MKKLIITLIPLFVLLLAACGHRRDVSTDYEAATCEELSLRIERGDSLTQMDYARIIGQNEAILKYIVEQAEYLDRQPDSLRASCWRSMTANPEYLERFGYMFTLGSALYSADIDGRLDQENVDAYRNLDKYNDKISSLSR